MESIDFTKGWIEPLFEMRSKIIDVSELLDDLMNVKEKKQQALVAVTFIDVAEIFKKVFGNAGLKCETIHRDKSLEERANIVSSLNKGELDVIIGVNMLKAGVQKPAFSLVMVVDTDLETYFQTFYDLLSNCKEAARAEDARVILYTSGNDVYKQEVDEINLLREKQLQYNKEHDIASTTAHDSLYNVELSDEVKNMTEAQLKEYLSLLKYRMMNEAININFWERAKIKGEIDAIKLMFNL